MIALRPAAATDLPAMAAAFVAAWRSGYRGVVPDAVIDALTVEGMTAELAPGFTDPDRANVVAVSDSGAVAGFARFGAARGNDGDGGYLASLYVDPAAGGLGVGRALLRHALDAMGPLDITLWVFDGNARATDIYRRAGFRPDGGRYTDPRYQTPQIRMLRPARNLPVPPRAAPVDGALADAPLPRIVEVQVQPIVRPLRRPFVTALRTVTQLQAHEVRLLGADGVVGIGTAVATPQITGDTDAAILAALRGPITDSLRRITGLRDGLSALGGAAPDVSSARAAADLALHDYACQVLGIALVDLLGGARSAPRSDMTISLAAPEAMAAAALQAVADGFDTVKLKLGDADTDAVRVRTVMQAMAHVETAADVRIRLDVNQAWAPEQAVVVLGQIAALDGAPGVRIELVEQPVAAADIAGMAFVRARSPFPVLADESAFTADDVARIADAEAADAINLKLLKCGGLAPARDVARICAEAGLGLLIGCMLEPAEGVRAASALASAATVGPLAHDLDAGWWVAD